MTTYETKREAIERAILPALGDYGTDYDVDAIADEVLEWYEAVNHAGQIVVTASGFRLRSGVDFWQVVASHDTTAGAS